MALDIALSSNNIASALDPKPQQNSEAAAVEARVNNIFENSAPIPTFSPGVEMNRIRQEGNAEDKDVALGRAFHQVMGGHGADGWCSYHAFNTHLLLCGKPQKEIVLPSEDTFTKFGNWFFNRFNEQLSEEEGIIANKGETQESVKNRVESKMKLSTKAGESAIISVGEGAHWYSVHNDGSKVWFIDSQCAKGFNLYTDYEPEKALEDEEIVHIIKVDKADVEDYRKLIELS